MTRGLVGYWSFDEGAGQYAYDGSGNANNGTLTNGPKWTTGKSGGALSFDGIDDYVDCGNKPSLDFSTNDFTVEVWAKAVGGTFGRGIINKGGWDSIGYSIQQAYSPANTYYFVARDSVGYKYVNLSLYETWNWTHIVGIKTTNHLEAWVNGKKSVNIMAPSVL
ncbi:MAG: hypothetical protein QMC83_10420, partial [Thermodesulfovibrionales bacterium]|nr:hypothetical protein [Thermodesulfovibrionales bacterium]